MSEQEVWAAPAARTEFPGAPNFRDLGGIPAMGGGRVAPGRLYRSEAFTSLQDEEWQAVRDLGVRLVCDLRSPQERTKHPLRWVGDAPRIVELAILPDVRTAGADIMRSIAEDHSGDYARNLLLENYAAMPAAFEGGFRALVESILDQGELPLLISCTAGKDRTGFVCAVLLRALGVAHEDVIADYLRSNDVFDAEGIRVALSAWLDSPRDLSDEVLDALKVHEEYLASAFAAIERSDGDLNTYLERVAGLDRRRRDALRAALLS